MTKTPHYHRLPHGKGFRYTDAQGTTVPDAIKSKIQALVIPPAWRDVEVNLSPHARIKATGYDDAGRKQYIYSAAYRARQERAKYQRLTSFAEALPTMRRITGQHLRRRKLDRNKVLACMVRLIDLAYFRVGNERYAKQNHTYGLTTLRSRHVSVQGDRLVFEYVGKSHQLNHREVEDGRLAKIVSELDHLPGYEIFAYRNDAGELVNVTSEDLNSYIKEVMDGDYSAKDFRTWAGTLIAAVALSEVDVVASPNRRHITAAVKHVAERLGNTPAIAKASYIDPRVIDHYLNGTTIASFLGRIDDELNHDNELSNEERALLSLLQRRLRHRTR